jgi:hypothetical protein
MATWEDVARIALALPETDEGISRNLRHWRVKDKGFVWSARFAAPISRPSATPLPIGPKLGARVEHLVAKEALLADDPDVFFTTALRRLSGRPRAPGPRLARGSRGGHRRSVASPAPKRLARAYVDESL